MLLELQESEARLSCTRSHEPDPGLWHNRALMPLQQLLDRGGVFVVAVDVVVSCLRNEVHERFHCRRLLTKNGHDLVLLFLRPPH